MIPVFYVELSYRERVAMLPGFFEDEDDLCFFLDDISYLLFR